MNDNKGLDTSKGLRKDGQYCFLKQFDMCSGEGSCKCDTPMKSDPIADILTHHLAYYAERIDEIEEED